MSESRDNEESRKKHKREEIYYREIIERIEDHSIECPCLDDLKSLDFKSSKDRIRIYGNHCCYQCYQALDFKCREEEFGLLSRESMEISRRKRTKLLIQYTKQYDELEKTVDRIAGIYSELGEAVDNITKHYKTLKKTMKIVKKEIKGLEKVYEDVYTDSDEYVDSGNDKDD